METPRDNAPDAVVRRLEEAQAFTEHRVDQLSQQVHALSEQMGTLERSIARLERRLGDLESPLDLPDALDERPPHSAG